MLRRLAAPRIYLLRGAHPRAARPQPRRDGSARPRPGIAARPGGRLQASSCHFREALRAVPSESAGNPQCRPGRPSVRSNWAARASRTAFAMPGAFLGKGCRPVVSAPSPPTPLHGATAAACPFLALPPDSRGRDAGATRERTAGGRTADACCTARATPSVIHPSRHAALCATGQYAACSRYASTLADPGRAPLSALLRGGLGGIRRARIRTPRLRARRPMRRPRFAPAWAVHAIPAVPRPCRAVVASTVIGASGVTASLALVPELSNEPLATAQLVLGASLAVVGVGVARKGRTPSGTAVGQQWDAGRSSAYGTEATGRS